MAFDPNKPRNIGRSKDELMADFTATEENQKFEPPTIFQAPAKETTIEHRVTKLEKAVVAAPPPDDTTTKRLDDIEKRLDAVEKVKQ